MIERLIRAALEQRLIVLLMVFGLIVSGVAAFRHLPIDAFPDVTPVQVQVITKAPTLAPSEIERLVTFPLEIELTNLPGKTELRSVSRFGLSSSRWSSKIGWTFISPDNSSWNGWSKHDHVCRKAPSRCWDRSVRD